MEYIKNQIRDSINLKLKILDSDMLLKTILRSAQLCLSAFKGGNKILLAGNGGSAADAQHLAAELVNRFLFQPARTSGYGSDHRFKCNYFYF